MCRWFKRRQKSPEKDPMKEVLKEENGKSKTEGYLQENDSQITIIVEQLTSGTRPRRMPDLKAVTVHFGIRLICLLCLVYRIIHRVCLVKIIYNLTIVITNLPVLQGQGTFYFSGYFHYNRH